MLVPVPKPISIAEARNHIAQNVFPKSVETVDLPDAVGRVAAADLKSDIDVTPFDDSAMDGFAVISNDVAHASTDTPVSLSCIAHMGAGDYFTGTLQPGQCIRIMTGAAVPAGADAVIPIEDASIEPDSAGSTGDTITFTLSVKPGKNIRKAGDEARAGEVVISKGEVITTAGIGLLASTGNTRVKVYARPKVAVITIGSELVDYTTIPGPGKIRDSNRWAMAAYVKAAGGIPRLYPRVADDEQAITTTFRQAVDQCDVVVSTGGACIGDYDLTPAVLDKLGKTIFTRVSMKPGKSQPFGLISGKPVFVLSGNPGASSVGFEMFARPALLRLQGHVQVDRPRLTATIDSAVKKNESRVFLQRGVMKTLEDGSRVVTQYRNQSSGLFGSLQRANCLIIIPEGFGGVQAGDTVECIMTGVDESLAW